MRRGIHGEQKLIHRAVDYRGFERIRIDAAIDRDHSADSVQRKAEAQLDSWNREGYGDDGHKRKRLAVYRQLQQPKGIDRNFNQVQFEDAAEPARPGDLKKPSAGKYRQCKVDPNAGGHGRLHSTGIDAQSARAHGHGKLHTQSIHGARHRQTLEPACKRNREYEIESASLSLNGNGHRLDIDAGEVEIHGDCCLHSAAAETDPVRRVRRHIHIHGKG